MVPKYVEESLELISSNEILREFRRNIPSIDVNRISSWEVADFVRNSKMLFFTQVTRKLSNIKRCLWAKKEVKLSFLIIYYVPSASTLELALV